MSEKPFMQLYVSDFLGDTLHLSTEQIGAYMLMLMAMWNAGGSLPDDEAKLARVVRMSVKKWRSVQDDLLAFFIRQDGILSHNRLTKELQKSEGKSQSRASAGAEGGRAKALKDKEARLANATVLPQHLPDTITIQKDKRTEPIGSDAKDASSVIPIDARTALFREGLASVAAMSGKKESACRSLLGKWLKQAGDDAAAVLATIRRAASLQVAEPVAWIERAMKPVDPDAAIYRGVQIATPEEIAAHRAREAEMEEIYRKRREERDGVYH